MTPITKEFPFGKNRKVTVQQIECLLDRLYRLGYRITAPTKKAQPNEFYLESLPQSSGFKVVIHPLPQHTELL